MSSVSGLQSTATSTHDRADEPLSRASESRDGGFDQVLQRTRTSNDRSAKRPDGDVGQASGRTRPDGESAVEAGDSEQATTSGEGELEEPAPLEFESVIEAVGDAVAEPDEAPQEALPLAEDVDAVAEPASEWVGPKKAPPADPAPLPAPQPLAEGDGPPVTWVDPSVPSATVERAGPGSGGGEAVLPTVTTSAGVTPVAQPIPMVSVAPGVGESSPLASTPQVAADRPPSPVPLADVPSVVRTWLQSTLKGNELPRTLEILLDPPELGEIRIQLEMGTRVQGTIQFADPRVAQDVERWLPDLEDEMNEHGASFSLFSENAHDEAPDDEAPDAPRLVEDPPTHRSGATVSAVARRGVHLETWA